MIFLYVCIKQIIIYMKRIALLLISVYFIGLNLTAQNAGNNIYNNQQVFQKSSRTSASNAVILNNNEITIEVNGLMNIMADNYVAVFNIIQVGETPESTNQLMNLRITMFKQELKKIGIDTTETKVDMISFVPRYDYQTESKLFSKSYNEIPQGFELQKNIYVRYRNSWKFEDIITAAATSEIYDLVKVDYFAPNIQRSMDSLRMECLQELKTKLKSYELIGFKLDTLKKTMVDNFSTVYPETRYFSYQAFSRPSLNAAKKKTTPPNINEIAKPNSKYYAQVDYDQYDLIINPIITEPEIQVSYSVAVKYFLKDDDKQKTSNNYYLITPNGDMKQIFPK